MCLFARSSISALGHKGTWRRHGSFEENQSTFLGEAPKSADMFHRKPILAFIAIVCATVSLAGAALAQQKSIVVASTTSAKDSGLFGHLLPIFTEATGIVVNVVAVGTGQALDIARRGDADVAFVHSKIAEQQFVAEGHGVKRNPVMYNDFVLVGPKSDPAGIKGMTDIAKALETIRNLGQRLFRVGTTREPICLNSRSGTRTLASTSRNKPAHGTNLSGEVWEPRSIRRSSTTATQFPTGAHGFISRNRVIWKLWLKATNACSINTASFW